MRAVGIKVLKDNLSRYLRYVKDGETVLVTDRDKVIAEIHRPTHLIPGQVTRWDAFINEEERRGSVLRCRSDAGPSLSALRQLERPRRLVDLQELLDEVKSD